MALEIKEIRGLLLAFTYGAAFCALFGIGKHFILHQDRIDSFSGDKMVFGGMLMAALLLQIVFLRDEPGNPLHWLSFALVGFGLLLTETRGAWVGFVFGLVFLLWRFGKKWIFAGVLALAVFYFLMPSSLRDRIKSITDISISYQNGQVGNATQTRLLIWTAGIHIIKDYPGGIGQGNLSGIYPRYRLKALDTIEPDVPHLHDNFLQICAQNGWLGLLAYLSWIFSYYWTALKRREQNTDSSDLNWGLVCVFSAVLIWGLTEYTFSHQFMNVQFFLLGLQLSLWKTGAAVKD